jgi:hypothetical protein
MSPNDGSDILNRLLSDQLLTEIQAAVRLGLKAATLRAWRHRGVGPPCIRLGRAIRYRADDIEKYFEATGTHLRQGHSSESARIQKRRKSCNALWQGEIDTGSMSVSATTSRCPPSSITVMTGFGKGR